MINKNELISKGNIYSLLFALLIAIMLVVTLMDLIDPIVLGIGVLIPLTLFCLYYVFHSLETFRIILLIYIFINFYFELEVFVFEEVLTVFISRLLLVPIVISWFLFVLKGQIKLTSAGNKIYVLLIMISIVQILIACFSPTMWRNLGSCLMEIVEYYLMCVIVLSTYYSSGMHVNIIKFIVGSMFVICIVSIFSWVINIDLAVLVRNGEIAKMFDWGYPYIRRAAFTYNHPIALGNMISMTIPWILFLYGKKIDGGSKRTKYLFVFGVSMFALLLTFARGPWITGLVALCFMGFKTRGMGKIILVFSLLMLVALSIENLHSVTGDSFMDIFAREKESSAMGRYEIVIRRGIELISEKPFAGWGISYTRKERDFGVFLAGIENYWISLGLAKGIIHVFSIVLAYLYLWRFIKTKRFVEETGGDIQRAFAAFLMCFIVNVTATGPMGSSSNYLWIMTGVLLSIR